MSGGGRLLLPLTYGFSVRYALPTGLIGRLARRGDVVVGLPWPDPELERRLSELGAEVIELPDPELDYRYRVFRRRLALLRDRRLGSPTTRIRDARTRAALNDRRELVIHTMRRSQDRVGLALPGGARRVEAAEPAEVERGTNVAAFRDLLDRHDLGSVLSLTPYHDHDALLLWAARSTGRPSMTSVISFDNPTTRERLLVRSERMLVWNRFNADELVRSYPELSEEQIGVIGAPQFDLHHRPDLRVSRDEWCDRLGLPRDRPIILYGAGPASLVPGELELARRIDSAIGDRRIQGEPYLLVRRHPVDPPGTWAALAPELRHGTVVDPWTGGQATFRSWPSDDEIVVQMSSLAHAEVHVNVCSTMSLDGAVFDRPQVGPTFVPGASAAVRRQIRSFARQEHWRPIALSGGIAPARNEEELVHEIGTALHDPAERRSGRRRMVADILTFDDGRSTDRLVDEVVAAGLIAGDQSNSEQ